MALYFYNVFCLNIMTHFFYEHCVVVWPWHLTFWLLSIIKSSLYYMKSIINFELCIVFRCSAMNHMPRTNWYRDVESEQWPRSLTFQLCKFSMYGAFGGQCFHQFSRSYDHLLVVADVVLEHYEPNDLVMAGYGCYDDSACDIRTFCYFLLLSYKRARNGRSEWRRPNGDSGA